MGLNVLGYQSHLLQRCHPACGHLRIFLSHPGCRLCFIVIACKYSTLATRQPMVEIDLLTFSRFLLRKKEHTRIELTISVQGLLGYLLDHSGDEDSIITVD